MVLKESLWSSSKYMKLNKYIDLKLTNYKAGITRNGEFLRVLSWDIQVFFEINKNIFVVRRWKVSNMQS